MPRIKNALPWQSHSCDNANDKNANDKMAGVNVGPARRKHTTNVAWIPRENTRGK